MINADNTASDIEGVMFLVLDKQCNGAEATAAQVLTGTNFGSALTNLVNSNRFVILKRWEIKAQPVAGVAAAFGNSSMMFTVYKKCNIDINFDATSTDGAITSVRSNNLFLMAGSIIGDDVWTVTGTSRIRYTDS